VVAAVAVTGWDLFYTTILREAFPRLLPFYDRVYHEHHSYWVEVLRHPFWVAGTALPISVLALFSWRWGFFGLWDARGRLLLQTMHCWVWPNLLFWTLISDHKPRHCFPLAPGPVKLVYVEVIMPTRTARAEPRAKGELIASLVPRGVILYVFRLKDEGIMYYFGGEVVRLSSFHDLPSHSEPMYCILDRSEWEAFRNRQQAEVIRQLQDEQGQPIVLVRVL
jgi:hypothetical protein